jgi:hypothetical protein
MPGLYPKDQTISLFGKAVRWPGLDPVTGKFTNGSFSDPLVPPSYIPADTINLIIDNLNNLMAGMGQEPNNTDPNQLLKLLTAVKESPFAAGDFFEQWPDADDPIEKGLPGNWAVWSFRSVMYGVSQSPPPSYVEYDSLAGTTIAAGVTPAACYHPNGSSLILYKFKARSSAYAVPEHLDPAAWSVIEPGVIDGRQKCGNALTEADYDIGHKITAGPYADFYVTQAIRPAGLFTGIEGGFRPTFVSGGVQQDRIRDITGSFFIYSFHTGMNIIAGQNGAFYKSGNAGFDSGIASASVNAPISVTLFSASRQVPTGPDAAPAGLSKRLWRVVSL